MPADAPPPLRLRAVTAGYRPGDDAERLAELARLCAHLPLALRIAADRAVTHPHLRLDDLIAEGTAVVDDVDLIQFGPAEPGGSATGAEGEAEADVGMAPGGDEP